MKRTLADHDRPEWLTETAARELELLRGSYDGLVGEGEAPLEVVGGGCQWHTFAGGAINRLLAEALEAGGAGKWTAGNLTLKSRKELAVSAAREAVAALGDADWDAAAARLLGRSSHITVSKFQPCLPDHLAARLMIERLTDVGGTRAFVSTHRVATVVGK